MTTSARETEAFPGRPAVAPQPTILGMAAPIILSFTMRSLFTFVDMFYASTLGDKAVAVVGALSMPLEFLMIAFWVGISTGLTSNLSRAMGARQGERIEKLLAVSRGIVWCVVPLGLPPGIAPLFGTYVGVLVAGSALSSFWSIIPDSIVKAHHDTRSTMWAGIWSNMINVVLNTVFLFVFHWGIFGIAFSTVLGRFGGLIYALRKAAAHEAARKAGGLDTAPSTEGSPLRSMLVLAVPSALTYTLMAFESTLVNWLLAKEPDSTSGIAAYGIYHRVLLFAVMPIMATAVAVLPYVARRFGESDLAAIRSGLRQAMVAASIYCVALVAPALALGGPFLARALAESPVTASLTRFALLIVPLACLASIPFILCRPAFEGLQRGQPGLVMAALRYLVLTVPCASLGMVLARRLGREPIYGMLLGLVAATALSSYIFQAWLRRMLQQIDRQRGLVGGTEASAGIGPEPGPATAP